MKILMMTDLEGVAGVVSFETQTYASGKHYDESRRLLTAEINAAVEGLLNAGAEDVLVSDDHGPGAVYFPDLHPAAKLLHGRPGAPRAVRDRFIADYDALIMIGQHAMAGAELGNLNHTQNSTTTEYIKLNGKPIGEIAQCALYYGDMGLPLLFLSGDEAACSEAEELVADITTAAVKQGLGRNSAISVSAAEAHKRIRSGVETALRRHTEDPVAPLKWDAPFAIERRFLQSDVADRYEGVAGVERLDSVTIRRTSDSIRDVIYT